MVKDHKAAFIRLFGDTARYRNRYEVFRDFVLMSGISLHNALAKSEELEQEYMAIVSQYEKDDANKMAGLFAEVVMGLESSPCDFLGSVFMSLELGSGHVGQFFTPFDVSKLMANLTFGDAVDLLDDQPFITLSEPACGAGGMVIAFAQTMLERGLNPQKQLWVSCVDVDPVAAMMCYLQLSLLHIPAEVVTGNTLSLKFTKAMCTPAHYTGFWDSKLKNNWQSRNIIPETEQEEVDPFVLPLPVRSLASTAEDQLSLFDLEV